MDSNNATLIFLGNEAARDAARIELYDVQGMWGGRKITATRGKVVVQIVGRGMSERRFQIEPGEDGWERLLDALSENDFLTIQPEDRPGIPDEAHPTITVTNGVGETHTIAKWAGVEDERFEAIYEALKELERMTEKMEPVYIGPFRS